MVRITKAPNYSAHYHIYLRAHRELVSVVRAFDYQTDLLDGPATTRACPGGALIEDIDAVI